jgi:hypothetical protein
MVCLKRFHLSTISVLCNLNNLYFLPDDQVKNDPIGGTRSTYAKVEKYIPNFSRKNLKGRGQFGDLGVDGE